MRASRSRVLVAAVSLVAAAAAACSRPSGSQALLKIAAEGGRLPASASLTLAGDTRPALIETTRWKVGLPRRPLLTLGAGTAWTGSGEPPGWFHLTVRLDGTAVIDRRLNPRALRGWRDISV